MQWKTNKLIDLKKLYINELNTLYSQEEADSMLSILIERFFQLSRINLALKPDFRLNESEMLRLHFAVKELIKQKPIQYITKSVEFLNTRIMVNESVLIPRPETEELVQFIISNEKETRLSVLDIGTGSGCIPIALAKNLVDATVTAFDISAEALKTASKNAFFNELMVRFKEIDILNPETYHDERTFDIIVSNPPYVTLSEKAIMKENVLKYEPHQALFVQGDDPLLFYKAILYFADDHLQPGGRIYFEINEKYGTEVCNLLKNKNYSDVQIREDIHGKERFVYGINPTS